MYFQFPIDTVITALFFGLLAYAAIKDVAEYRIPNPVTVSVALLYPAHVLASSMPVDWIGGLIVAAITLLIAAALFAGRIMGGGDVKLMTAVSLWAGPAAIADFIVVMALSGGLMAVVMYSPLRHGLALAFDKVGNDHARDAVLGKLLPYGVAIAAGGLAVGFRLPAVAQY